MCNMVIGVWWFWFITIIVIVQCGIVLIKSRQYYIYAKKQEENFRKLLECSKKRDVEIEEFNLKFDSFIAGKEVK